MEILDFGIDNDRLARECEDVYDSLSNQVYNVYENNPVAQAKLISIVDDKITITPKLSGSYTEDIIKMVYNKFKFNRVFYRKLYSRRCYAYHDDSKDLNCFIIHIPIILEEEKNFFIYDGKIYQMKKDGNIYKIMGCKMHTAVNASYEPRFHIAFCN